MYFDEYIQWGSFPGVFDVEQGRHREALLQTYYQAIVSGDFLETIGSVDIMLRKLS